MMRYVSMIKGSFMAAAAYPIGLFFMLFGNLIYVVVTYFLWKQIYSGQDVLKGMTFNQTFVYLTLASSILILFKTYTDWAIARQILDGSIMQDLIKPIDYEWQQMARSLGDILFSGIIITIPTLIVIVLIFHAAIPAGINLLFIV